MITKSYNAYGTTFPTSIRQLRNLRWRLMFNEVAGDDLKEAAELVAIYMFLISITDEQRNEVFSEINKSINNDLTETKE